MKIKIALISLLIAPVLVFAQAGSPAEGLSKAGLTPESPFYFLDKIGEALQDFLTFNPEAKARLQVAYAAERVAEIKIILETKGVEAKGLDVAKARLEANAARAATIVEKEKGKGKDVSKLAGEIVDNFHLQRKAAKQAFDAAKDEFKTKKRELHNQLLAAIEAGDTVLQEQIRAELVQIETAKDEAEAKKDATIASLEAEKDRLQDELEEKKLQEDEARDAVERADDERKRVEERQLELEERMLEEEVKKQEKLLKAETRENEQIEKEAERAQEQIKKEQEKVEKESKRAEEKQREAEEKLRELEEKESE